MRLPAYAWSHETYICARTAMYARPGTQEDRLEHQVNNRAPQNAGIALEHQNVVT